jgi:hypothetical protein
MTHGGRRHSRVERDPVIRLEGSITFEAGSVLALVIERQAALTRQDAVAAQDSMSAASVLAAGTNPANLNALGVCGMAVAGVNIAVVRFCGCLGLRHDSPPRS